MKKFETTAERAAQLAKLTGYLESQVPGAILDWLSIEKATGIKMFPATCKGRALVTHSLRKLGIPWTSLRGKGIQLGSPDNGVAIIEEKKSRARNSIKKYVKTVSQVDSKYFDGMTPENQAKVLQNKGFSGAMKTFTGPPVKRLTSANPGG